jgi:hypothetical protein
MVHYGENILVVEESSVAERRGAVTSKVETHILETSGDIGELMTSHPSIGDAGMDEDDRPVLPTALECDEGVSGRCEAIGHIGHPATLSVDGLSRPSGVARVAQGPPAGIIHLATPIPRPQTVGAFRAQWDLSRQRRSLLASPLS